MSFENVAYSDASNGWDVGALPVILTASTPAARVAANVMPVTGASALCAGIGAPSTAIAATRVIVNGPVICIVAASYT
ncbi:MAG: hypothetical protein QOD51_2762 [Candidatus Eremiobacteraeota bacterium]|nr:hypothetical protein [Candidatus Eremiobacteraeota bacterium]